MTETNGEARVCYRTGRAQVADSGREPGDEFSCGSLFHPGLYEPSRGAPGKRSAFKLSVVAEGLPRVTLLDARYLRSYPGRRAGSGRASRSPGAGFLPSP